MGENQPSVWYRDINLPEYPVWSGKGKTEVVVIGGGLVGILTAFFLKEAGKKVILLEADRITGGQTGRTTAKITSQHGLFYGKYQERLGTERLRQYAAANEQAIRRYRTLVKKRKIDCDWQDCNAYLYADGTKESLRVLEQEWKGAAAAGIEAKLCCGQDVPDLVRLAQDREAGAVCFPGQAAFHPLKFLQALLPGLEIYERSPVEEVEEHRVLLAAGPEGGRGSIEAEQIVFACHYPFLYRPGYYFLRLHQERSYVLAVRSRYRHQIQDLFYPVESGGLSVRPWGEYLLLGGAGHRTGETVENSYEKLRELAAGFDPDHQEIAHWSAQDTFSLDELPYIGGYSPAHPDWYVATGFKKWGMTHSMIAAELITAQITGQPAAQNLFDPSRFLLSASAFALAEESLQVAAGLAKSVVDPPRCTHLGCSLVWNEAEGTWDCPCHGSRFQGRIPADESLPAPGQVLDGPARRPLHGSVPPTDTAG